MIAVRMRGISKRYLPSGVHANDGAELAVERGSIHAIVGENGAGKTTLMKILAGLELPDSGDIEIDGKPTQISSPAHAHSLGIGMVHQHFLMFDELSAAENIFFGLEPERKPRILGLLGIIDSSGLSERTRRLAREYGFAIDPSAPVGTLSISSRQQVEILRQLAREMQILILDEPTSVLTEQETEVLFEKLAEIRRMGRTILLVTHKIDEVIKIADRVTVMRQGKTIGTYDIASTSANELAGLIMGTASRAEEQPRRGSAAFGPTLIRVENLCTRRHRQGGTGLSDIAFDVHGGEVLGICALSSNGLDELEDVLAGFLVPSAGTCLFGEHRFDARKVHEYRRFLKEGKIAYLPSDRVRRSAALSLSVKDNFIALSRRNYFPRGWIQSARAQRATQEAIRAFDISAQPEQSTGELSGGNIQKLAIARLFSRERPELFILCEPTWGLDIRSTEQVHRRIHDATEAGSAVLLLSSDVDEILSLADRILVLYRGKQVLAEKIPGRLNRALIGEYLLGTRSA
jgi:simple sugar transport system ATP-binding protein